MATQPKSSAPPTEAFYDVVIIGGGSAGCVVANRLSSDPSVRVLLVEAGREYSDAATSPLLDSAAYRCLYEGEFYWPNITWDSLDGHGGKVANPLITARLLGGGAAINGLHAQRGAPADYDEWAHFGVVGWSWHDVLPYFKKLEGDMDFAGPVHNADGPLKIERVPVSAWGPLALAVRDAWQQRGMHWIDDINREVGDGVGPLPLTMTGQIRNTTLRSYLGANVRGRANLSVLSNQMVRCLLFKDNKVSGVALESGQTINSTKVVVCCGAINTPALLLRSGIGPGEALRAAQIPVVADRRGVGANLRNHPFITVSTHVRSKGRQPKGILPSCVLVGRYSSKVDNCPSTDMSAMLWERVPGSPLKWDPLARHIASITTLINKSYSTGRVSLNSQDIYASPRVEIDLVNDQRDFDRIKNAFLFSWGTMTDAGVAEYVNESFIAVVGKLSRIHLQNNIRAAVVSALGSLALDGPDAIRRTLLRSMFVPFMPDFQDNSALTDLVRKNVTAMGHWMGTCRLGVAGDINAVIDSRCRVIGVDGVWVADASIFPTPMAAGTNLPTIMAAEKCSAMILEDAL